MRALVLFYLIVAACVSVIAQPGGCPCNPGTAPENQHRSGAKHETQYGLYSQKKDTITVLYIYGWQEKYEALTTKIKTDPSKASSKRKQGTPEDSLYVLKGYLWFVKNEDDCDFHMEIGTDNPNDTRIIAEVTRENTAVQKKIKQELDKRHLHMKGCKPGHSGKVHFSHGIPVVISGLGFYDASHKPGTNHGDAHTKRYSWELHPVEDVVFVK